MGRLKTVKNEPRPCDIDIIDFKGLVVNSTLLKLPHPKLNNRNFVLFPLKEIAPFWRHPQTKKKIDILLNELSTNSRLEITRLYKSDILVSNND